MTTKIKLSSNVGDVDISTTPTNGQALVYSTASSKWVPGAAAGGGVTTYSTIDDLPLTGVSEGALALVDSTNKLYLWMDTGWYNIATINTNPSITSGNDTPYLLALDGTPTVITLVASDPEGIPITWSYEVTSGSLTNGGGTTATVSNDGDGQFTITPTTTEDYAGAFSITFKASDGVNLGTALSEFTLAFRVLDSKYTTLLVKAEATGANATFVDGSTNAFTVTKNGDVTQGTFSPFSQPDGAWSTYFNGSSRVFSAVDAAIAPANDTTWTMEFMVFAQDFSTVPCIMTNGVYGTNINARVSFDASGNLEYLSGSDTWGYTAQATATTAMTKNAWHHCVITRSGTALNMYLDGTSVYTNASFNFGSGNTGYVVFGDYFGNGAQYFNGYLSNFRYTKADVYSGTVTTPTGGLDVLANTSLLWSGSNRFLDAAGTLTFSTAGTPAVSPVSPFDRLAYDPAVHGGGAYFDGSGDYLTLANNTEFNLAAGSWTVECSVYLTAGSGYRTFVSKRSGVSAEWELGIDPSGYLYFYTSTLYVSTAFVANNVWTHCAATYDGTNLRLFVDGQVVHVAAGVTAVTGSSTVYVGATYPAGGQYVTGHISNLRVIKGTALYTAAFTPPTEPLTAITNTSLLLKCTNASIIDYSSKNNLNVVGNTTPSATQTKYAARSVYFDGSGDYLTIPDAPVLKFGGADFTVECWVYLNTVATNNIVSKWNAGGTPATNQWLLYTSSASPRFIWSTDGTNTSGTAIGTTLTTGVWHHLAAVRNGSSVTLYVDGVGGTPVSISGSLYGAETEVLGISYRRNNGSTQYPIDGYIEDLRITKGLARYTADFTPPTTELLG